MFKKILGINLPTLALLLACFSLTAWAAHEVYWHNAIQIYEENGLLEDLQAAILALTALLFLVNAVVEKQRSDKLLLLFCAQLCYCFCLREMDVETFDIPRIFILLGSGIGRHVTVAAGFVAIIGYAAYTNFWHYLHAAWAFIRSVPGVLILYAGLCLVMGEYFEKHVPVTHHAFLEETSELFGYVLLLIAAFTTNSFLNKLRLGAADQPAQIAA